MHKTVNKIKFFITAITLLSGVFGLLQSSASLSIANQQIKEQVGSKPNRTNNGVIVRTINPTSLNKHAKNEKIKVLNVTSLPGKETLVTLEGKVNDAALKRLSNKANKIITSEISPNYSYRLTTSHAPPPAPPPPNDQYYSDQWSLSKISAPNAWSITKGSADVTIAVLDTGVLSSQQWGSKGPFDQPDFPQTKMWNNPAEMGATTEEGPEPNCTSRGLTLDKTCNNLDDDGNGKRDDWRGWDFMGGFRGDAGSYNCPNDTGPGIFNGNYVPEDNDPQPYSCDDYTDSTQLNKDHYNGGCDYGSGACYIGHGTSVASVAAAETNNSELVAGVDWNAKVMNLRVLDGYGGGDSASITAAIDYARVQGADVINMSLALFDGSSCTTTDESVERALGRAKNAGIVSVAASGNGGNQGVCYPARSSHVMATGSSDENDSRSSFSTYGPELDLLAPGSSVPAANAPSAAANTNYRSAVSGTSLATPHVAGAAASIKAILPDANPSEVRDILIQNTDKLADMNGANKTNQHGYGRLNLIKSYEAAVPLPGTYGNIRLFTCGENKYMVERGIYRKRLLSQTAMTHWQLGGLEFNTDNDHACGYPTFSLPLDRILRSRSTGKEYLVDAGKAHYIHDKSSAHSWGVGNYANITYPQLDGASIHFLNVVRELPHFKPNLGNSNIRLFKCGNQNYMVERFIRRKRAITANGQETWGLSRAYFAPEDSGCDYPAYTLNLDNILRSRTTGKEYLTDRIAAYHIINQEVANDWALGNVSQQTYPQFNGKSIHFLNVVRELPRVAKSASTDKVYLVNNGSRHFITGSDTADTTSLQLVRGYNEVPMATYSSTLLQTLVSSGDINYSFQIGDDWYLLDHNRTRKVNPEYATNWQHLTGPALSGSILSVFDRNYNLDYYWERDEYHYRITETGELERTTDSDVVDFWNISNPPVITRLLTNKLINELGVTDVYWATPS